MFLVAVTENSYSISLDNDDVRDEEEILSIN